MSYVSLGPAESHVMEMLSRLPDDPAEVNGNLVRGLLKTIQGEAQTRRGRTQAGTPTSGPTSTPASRWRPTATPKPPPSRPSVPSSSSTGAVPGTTYPSQAAATVEPAEDSDQSSAAVDRWEILMRKHLRFEWSAV